MSRTLRVEVSELMPNGEDSPASTLDIPDHLLLGHVVGHRGDASLVLMLGKYRLGVRAVADGMPGFRDKRRRRTAPISRPHVAVGVTED